MTKLDEIIEKHCYITQDDEPYDVHSSVQSVKDAMLEFAKHILEEAAENAMVYQHSRDFRSGVKSKIVRQKIMISEVDKKSITDTLKKYL